MDTMPPMASTPWLVTFTSAMKSTIAKRISSRPAKLIGRLWNAKNARISEMPPMTPGRIAPGVDSSKMRPSVPSIIKTYATFGSVMTASTRSRKPISIGLATASRVASVTGPRDVFTVRPSSFVSRSGMESAMKSTTFSRTASRSVTDTDWRTAFSPQSAVRPRSTAMVRMKAAASFSTLRMLSLSTPPPTATGCAAPMLVAGAIAATLAAIVMNTPAEAARAPVGPTHTTTGISALSRRWQIARIERSRPPGVSSWITSACAPSAFARAIALSTSRSVTGLMTPSTTTVATGAGAAHAGAARRTSSVRTNRPRRRRVIVLAGGPDMAPRPPALGRVPAEPWRASGRHALSSSEREHAHELEHEVRGEQRGDLSGAVVGRRDLDDVGAHQRVARQRAHQRQRLEGREPAHLGRARGRRVRRIDGVDVERAVDRAAAQPRQPLGRPRGALLLHGLDAQHLDSALVVEREILRPVQRPADAHLDHAAPVDGALLDGAAKRRAVEELAAEVFVPRVGMRVEVHDAERTVAARQRAQDGQRDRVVAAHAHRCRTGLHDGVDPPLDRLERPLDRDRHHVHVAAVGHAQPLERMHLQHRVPRPDERRLLAHGARAEARARAVRGAAVVRHAEQRDIQPGKIGGRGQEHERRDLPEARRLKRV